jgi:DNA replication protein DnaC
VKRWHELISEPTRAEAILDRLVQSTLRQDVKGTSMLSRKEKKNQDE